MRGGDDKERNKFNMSSNAHWNRGGLKSNKSRSNWAAINDFDWDWLEEFDERKCVFLGKVSIHEAYSSTRVQERRDVNGRKTCISEGCRDDKRRAVKGRW